MFVRFHVQFWQIVWHLKSVFASLILMVVTGAILIAYAEPMDFDDSQYFAFVAGLTIGYGDIVLISAAGRILSIMLGFIGILFTGLVVAMDFTANLDRSAEG